MPPEPEKSEGEVVPAWDPVIAEPSRRANWLVGAIMVGAVGLAGIGLMAFLGEEPVRESGVSEMPSASADPVVVALKLPRTVDGYRLDKTSSAAGLAVIGLYVKGDQRFVYSGMLAEDSRDLREELSDGPSGVVERVLAAAEVPGAASFGAGPRGGLLRCGEAPAAGRASVCVWANGSMTGTITAGSEISPDALASLVIEFRQASEG